MNVSEHWRKVTGTHEGWVPPPPGTEHLIVVPTNKEELIGLTPGIDSEGKICYRVIASRWRYYYHWKLKKGSWLHCRSKVSYDSFVKYTCSLDGDYRNTSISWHKDLAEAMQTIGFKQVQARRTS